MGTDSPLDVDAVVLVRLLARPEKFAMSVLVKDLQSLLWLEDKTAAREAAEAAITRLKKVGHVWPDTKFILTDEGKTAALEQLGLSGMPQRQRTDWRWAKKLLLVRRFRLSSGATGDAGKSAHLAAWVVAFKEKLRINGPPTPAAVLQALAWRALGLPDKGPLRGNAAVGALLALAHPDVQRTAPRRAEDNPDQAVAAEVQPDPGRFVSERSKPERATPADPSSADLRKLADTVNALALSAKTGTWIGNKVYVAQVWRDLKPEAGAAKPSLDAFKQRLVAAARAGLILLSRADLVGAYPPAALKESKIEVGSEVYHFIETEHLRRAVRVGS